MPTLPRILKISTALLTLGLPARAVSLLQFHVPVTENFDSLAASGTSAALPAGWSFAETGSGANTTYAAGTGSSGTGNTYSFGASGAADRALGAVRSSSLTSAWGVSVTNQTGAVLAGLALAYRGEQWRLGSTGRADRLDFAYSLTATSLAGGTWIDVDAVDFVAPVTAGAVGALNGNLLGNQVGYAWTLSGLTLAPGAGLRLRWTDFDAAGADDGLAIDAVSVTALPAPRSTVPDGLPPGTGAVVLAAVVAAAAARRRTTD